MAGSKKGKSNNKKREDKSKPKESNSKLSSHQESSSTAENVVPAEGVDEPIEEVMWGKSPDAKTEELAMRLEMKVKELEAQVEEKKKRRELLSELLKRQKIEIANAHINSMLKMAPEKYRIAWNYREINGYEVIKDEWTEEDDEKIQEFDEDLKKLEKFSKLLRWDTLQYFTPAIPVEEEEKENLVEIPLEATLEIPVEEKKAPEKYRIAWNYREINGYEVIKDEWTEEDDEKIQEFDEDLKKLENFSKLVRWDTLQYFTPAIPVEEEEKENLVEIPIESPLETPVEEKKGPFPIVNSDEEVTATAVAGQKKKKSANPLDGEALILPPPQLFKGESKMAIQTFSEPPTIECPLLEEFATKLNETDSIRLVMSSSNAGSRLFCDEDPFPIVNSDEDVTVTAVAGQKKKKRRIVKASEKEKNKKAKSDMPSTENPAQLEKTVPPISEEPLVLPLEPWTNVSSTANNSANPLDGEALILPPPQLFKGESKMAIQTFSEPPTIECPLLEEFATKLNETDSIRLVMSSSNAGSRLFGDEDPFPIVNSDEEVTATAEFDEDLKKLEKFSKLVRWDTLQYFTPVIPVEEEEKENLVEIPLEAPLETPIEEKKGGPAQVVCCLHVQDDVVAAAIEEVNLVVPKCGAHRVAVAGLKRLRDDRPIKAKWFNQLLIPEPKKTMHEAMVKVLTKLSIEQLPLWEALTGAMAKMNSPSDIVSFPGDASTIFAKGPSGEESIPDVLDE
ncbi:OLC1v1000843C1 [Oldenlandia corymbosa var. corymbosa]|uniref:OLC1v1000843C1 n=1 Tax=Oldenlandia corymbosa var. corymbosa TaxID=529605 RepID=A0AAV1D3V0_OLDCO|nr:OLC1v1000843C1 [Oldenlandia corymbosa var. corymbosa]